MSNAQSLAHAFNDNEVFLSHGMSGAGGKVAAQFWKYSDLKIKAIQFDRGDMLLVLDLKVSKGGALRFVVI